MGQLSFFSAQIAQPAYEDLEGLLATHGQAVRSDSGTRVSVVVAEEWRAVALVEEISATGVDAEIVFSDEGSPIARTAPSHEFDELHRRWLAGAVKAMPAGWVPSPRALRLWTIAAGERDEDRYLLGLDAHAPEMHAALATALMRVGVAPTLVGTRGKAPALRVAGKRRLTHLLEYVGDPPTVPGAAEHWPVVVGF
ncbi:hypothetical protein [Gordonia rhizosphera]|uniref:Uncharacterized protein n=1 Tax=Gordonia rhizosphera NBRC 16068 TaxID=1108045 RepID=K6WA09_9ACTN|nr:hypothetical protein [Gordonia rhizosphera]GAB89047.1 hypothetical protein GORHZ_048_00240 [Gordonia rhizosphera NBRC 16068]